MRSPLFTSMSASLCACLLLSACDKTPETPPTPPAEAPVAVATDDASAPNDEAGKEAPAKAANKAEDIAKVEARRTKMLKEAHDTTKGTSLRQTFIGHLKAGRVLVQKKDYVAGLAELEKARAIDPNDARILSEIGFAAMLADDLATARKANLDSVRFAKEDNLKAASLYNLGRIAEKESQKEVAAGYYTQSLALRPNKTVQERLGALQVDVVAPPSSPTACALTAHKTSSKEEVCAALATHIGVESPVCGKSSDFGAGPELKIYDVSAAGFERAELLHFYGEEDSMTEYFYLGILDKAGSWHTLPLYSVYNPGAFGIYEDISPPEVSVEKLMGDDSSQIVARVGHLRNDSDMAGAELTTEDLDGLIVIGKGADGTPTLLAGILDGSTFSFEQVDFGEEESPFGSGGLPEREPVHERFESGSSFDHKGNLSIKTSSKDSQGLEAGTYKLGAPELLTCSFTN